MKRSFLLLPFIVNLITLKALTYFPQKSYKLQVKVKLKKCPLNADISFNYRSIMIRKLTGLPVRTHQF